MATPSELAANISEARTILAGGGIELLLLDYRLEEGENGLEFYRQLQARKAATFRRFS